MSMDEALRNRIAYKPRVIAPGADRDGLFWARENYRQNINRQNEPRIVPIDKILIGVIGRLLPGGKRPGMTDEAVRAALLPVIGERLSKEIHTIRRGSRPGLMVLGIDHPVYSFELRCLKSEIVLALRPFGVGEVQFCVEDDSPTL